MYLQYIWDDVSFTLLEEGILVEGRVRLQDLSQNLGHLRLREQPT